MNEDDSKRLELHDEVEKLNQMIKDSQEYRMYIYADKMLRIQEELFNATQEYKRKYEDIQRYTEGNPYDEIQKLYYENDELLHNSTVNEYLRAESAFFKLMRDVIDGICDEIKID